MLIKVSQREKDKNQMSLINYGIWNNITRNESKIRDNLGHCSLALNNEVISTANP